MTQPTVPDKNIDLHLRFKAIYPRCPTCKNSNLYILTPARWSNPQQNWVIEPLPRNTTHNCPTCGPITLDQDTAEELVIILKQHYPDGNITPTTQSFHHFIRIHKLQRIAQQAQQKLQKHNTGQQ